ncbi:MAG: tRNA-uridine aminocarboxypropyltransferase [Byssovorax sp.]
MALSDGDGTGAATSTSAAPAPQIRSRRTARCSACWLPSALCICTYLPRLSTRTRVIIVMHRREAVTSTNTGRLAAQILDGAELRVRGRKDAPEPPPLPEGRRLTLFPREGARPLGPEDAGAVLLVPDGTWSQARRLVLRDDVLRAGEVVSLPDVAPSQYGLRRHAREGALCTLEAVARALGVLEGALIEAALLTALARFVEHGKRARAGLITP